MKKLSVLSNILKVKKCLFYIFSFCRCHSWARYFTLISATHRLHPLHHTAMHLHLLCQEHLAELGHPPAGTSASKLWSQNFFSPLPSLARGLRAKECPLMPSPPRTPALLIVRHQDQVKSVPWEPPETLRECSGVLHTTPPWWVLGGQATPPSALYSWDG